MFDSCEVRIHPTGKAIARFGTKSQGQGHETTYAQILAEELGIPFTDIQIEEGDTDTAPYGLEHMQAEVLRLQAQLLLKQPTKFVKNLER